MLRRFLAAAMLLLAGGGAAAAQIQWATGQNVAPVFEGWIRNPDGSYDMVFGYLNRNWEELLKIPVGPDNHVEPGGPDRGQPTVFFPRKVAQPPGERREQFVFRVRVPKEWKPEQELIWTVTANGRTDRAVATLNPLEEMDNGVIAMNRGANITAEANEPPLVQLSASRQLATTDDAVQLTALVSDDGQPRQRLGSGPVASGPPQGLSVRWIHYRGPGTVTFTPPRSAIATTGAITDGKASTSARFSEPGTYVLRAFADDSSLFGTADVTVVVRASAASGENRKP